MSSETKNEHITRAASLSLGMLRLAVWTLFVLGLATAPVDATHATAKSLGDAVEFALDTSVDSESEELDGDGNGLWLASGAWSALARLPLRPRRADSAFPRSCVRPTPPARGPPEAV